MNWLNYHFEFDYYVFYVETFILSVCHWIELFELTCSVALKAIMLSVCHWIELIVLTCNFVLLESFCDSSIDYGTT